MSDGEYMTVAENRRILIVDDNETIHGDFRKILATAPRSSANFRSARAALFGETPAADAEPQYELESAFQGEEALELVRRACREDRPYPLAFIDVRMPPGWDGVETIERIWAEYPDLEVVICTAYSDYSWDDLFRRLGRSDRLLILKKPFDAVEVRQLACALTAKWRLARQARLKQADLERMVTQRNAELSAANERLREAKALADEANRAKGDFLANVSHEIRTPMTAILGNAELLSDPEQSLAERTSSVQSIQRNGRHLLELINDILDLSKIEAGMLPIETASCSPLEILADVASLMRVRAAEKKLAFDVRCLGMIPERVRTDPTRLRQILINLVGNSIKFTRAGSVSVTCRLEVASDGGPSSLRFDVQDTGIGLTPQQIGRLFRPFSQADATTSRTFGGTGLGLSISKRLAEALGGAIAVTSEPEVGTTFTVTIATGDLTGVRLFDGQEGIAIGPCEANRPDQPPVAGDALTGCRVLLAEDGPDNQRLIALHLKRAGASVEIVENGRMAVETVLDALSNQRPFDVVLMDMQMPLLDGYAATRELRQQGYRAPIVALTANAMTDDRAKCLKAGCDDYCTKPLEPRRLIGTIAALAERNRSERSAVPARETGTVESAIPDLYGSNPKLEAAVHAALVGRHS